VEDFEAVQVRLRDRPRLAAAEQHREDKGAVKMQLDRGAEAALVPDRVPQPLRRALRRGEASGSLSSVPALGRASRWSWSSTCHKISTPTSGPSSSSVSSMMTCA
jgi:hypothetical protein